MMILLVVVDGPHHAIMRLLSSLVELWALMKHVRDIDTVQLAKKSYFTDPFTLLRLWSIALSSRVSPGYLRLIVVLLRMCSETNNKSGLFVTRNSIRRLIRKVVDVSSNCWLYVGIAVSHTVSNWRFIVDVSDCRVRADNPSNIVLPRVRPCRRLLVFAESGSNSNSTRGKGVVGNIHSRSIFL